MPRLLGADGIDVLVHRVSRSHVPVFTDALHRRQDLNELPQFPPYDVAPAFTDMPVEGEGLVLREDVNATQIGVDAIGESDVNNAVNTTESHRRLGAIARQGIETFSRPSCQQNSQGISHLPMSPAPRYRRWSTAVPGNALLRASAASTEVAS